MGEKGVFKKTVSGKKSQKLAFIKKLFTNSIVLFLAIAVLLFSGCTLKNADQSSAIQGQESGGITITYSGKDIQVNSEEFKQFQVVEKEVPAISKTDGEVKRKVKGYLLEDVIKKYTGKSLKELQGISFTAGDNYFIEVPPEVLSSREIMLAFEIDGKPLAEDEKPFRSVVPGEFEMYWVKNLVKIEIVEGRVSEAVKNIIFIDNLAEVYQPTDYDYYGSMDKAVSLKVVIAETSAQVKNDNVYILAADGMEKNEKPANFIKGYLKLTGDDSPAFVSEEIPKGMWVKSIYYFLYGDLAFFSAKSSFVKLKAQKSEDTGGKYSVNLKEVFDVCGIADSDKYIFSATDDYEVEINSADIQKGYLYFEDDGSLSLAFKDLPKNTTVKHLLGASTGQ